MPQPGCGLGWYVWRRTVPKKVGTNFNLPGKDFPTIGALPAAFPEGFVRYFDLDWKKKQTVFKDGIGYDSAKLIESVRGVVGSR